MTPFQGNCQAKQLFLHQMLLGSLWSPGAVGPKPFSIPQASNSVPFLTCGCSVLASQTHRASMYWVVSSLLSEPDSDSLPMVKDKR